MARNCMPIIENRRARHDYDVLDTLQCGIVLTGNEIKSLRAGMANLSGAWCGMDDKNLVLHGMHITRYDKANLFDVDEKRDRVLLAHKREISKLAAKIAQDGTTLVPLKIEWSRQYCKVLVGICKGRKNYDKRDAAKKADAKREMDRARKEMTRR